MKQFVHSAFVALPFVLLFSVPYMPMAYAAGHFDDTLNPMATVKLPTCNSGTSGSRAAVNDFSGTASWNGPVVGGGTGTASVYCDGASWKIVAGGGAAANTSVVLAAPITPNAVDSSNLNYQTGCASSPALLASTFSNRNCLMFDDHWTTTPTGSTPITSLSSSWFDGYYRCNGGTGGNANCVIQNNFNGGVTFPWSGWCWGGDPTNNGCQSAIYWDYPVSFANHTTISGLPNTSEINTDGSLRLSIINIANSTLVADSGCTNPTNNEFLQCQDIFWLGGGITTGGLSNPSGDTNFPTNLNALIPANGGLFQFRMRQDPGYLDSGGYTGIECDAVDGTGAVNGNSSNSNFEFGYTNGGHTAGSQGIGQGLNNGANELDTTINGSINGTTLTVTNVFGTTSLVKVGTTLSGAGIVSGTRVTAFGSGNGGAGTYTINKSNSVPLNSTFFGMQVITTGDDGVGVGDATNWHTYALEYTGNATHQWNYYIDGVPLPVGGKANSHNEVNLPAQGYSCTITTGMNGLFQASYHSQFDPNNPGGPYHLFISDVQVLKRPGT